MVFLLLDFLAAERHCISHLETFRDILYYDRAYDHYKCEFFYIYDMEQSPLKHPYSYEKFISGYHSIITVIISFILIRKGFF